MLLCMRIMLWLSRIIRRRYVWDYIRSIVSAIIFPIIAEFAHFGLLCRRQGLRVLRRAFHRLIAISPASGEHRGMTWCFRWIVLPSRLSALCLLSFLQLLTDVLPDREFDQSLDPGMTLDVRHLSAHLFFEHHLKFGFLDYLCVFFRGYRQFQPSVLHADHCVRPIHLYQCYWCYRYWLLAMLMKMEILLMFCFECNCKST